MDHRPICILLSAIEHIGSSNLIQFTSAYGTISYIQSYWGIIISTAKVVEFIREMLGMVLS